MTEVYVEDQMEEEGILLDQDEWEKAGFWEVGSYHFRLESLEDKKDEEISYGKHAGEKTSYLNLRWVAFEQALYNEEGYFTGETVVLDPKPSRYEKLHLKGPFAKKGVKKYKSLCETALRGADKGVFDSETKRYNASRLAESLVKAEVWCSVLQFKNEDDEWVEYMGYYSQKPARKISRS